MRPRPRKLFATLTPLKLLTPVAARAVESFAFFLRRLYLALRAQYLLTLFASYAATQLSVPPALILRIRSVPPWVFNPKKKERTITSYNH